MVGLAVGCTGSQQRNRKAFSGIKTSGHPLESGQKKSGFLPGNKDAIQRIASLSTSAKIWMTKQTIPGKVAFYPIHFENTMKKAENGELYLDGMFSRASL